MKQVWIKTIAIVFGIAFVSGAIFLGLKANSNSIDRALLVVARNELATAYKTMERQGTFSNSVSRITVRIHTNRYIIEDREFDSMLSAQVVDFENCGFLSLTKDGVYIWVDVSAPPSIVGGEGVTNAVPARFQDFW